MTKVKIFLRSCILSITCVILAATSSLNVYAGDTTFFGTNDIIYYDPDVCSGDDTATATPSTATGDGIYAVDNKKPSGTQYHPGDNGFGTATDPYTYQGGNSINGITEAIKKGTYGQIDQDTRITKDGVPVFNHNSTPGSMGYTGPGADKDVKDLTLAQIKGLRNHGVQIATLEEVLSYVKSKQSDIRVQIEWKPNRIITEAEISNIANLFNKYGVKGAFKGGAKHKAIADSLPVAQKHGFWVRSTKDDGNGWVAEEWHAPTVTSTTPSTASASDSTVGAPVNITLAQANVQTPNLGHYTKTQRERVVATIGKFSSDNPDFITLNEIAPDTDTNYADYKSFKQNYPGADTNEDSALRILWNSTKWKKIDGGIKLIHPYETDPAKQIGAKSNWKDRYALWATFQNIGNSATTSVIATHWTTRGTFPPNHERARTQGKNINILASELLQNGPVLLAGDLNFQLYDADKDYSPASVLGEIGLKPVFKKGEGSAVDWMFYSDQLHVTSKRVIAKSDTTELSDHPYLIGKFQGSGGSSTGSGGGGCCAAPSISNTPQADLSNPGSSGSSGSYTIDQVKAFATQSITSTWNISDSTAEQWFLKQAGARSTITRYGLTSSNIGDITSAVKAAQVSPIFFYAYAATEGGGAGGFINHYGNEAAGGGVGNAKRDAEYLTNQSKIMDSKPSWIDAGNPVDFVPNDVKTAGNADFKNMPSGTIGRAYIPATAATTWEVYYPNGLKEEYNKVQDYGTPLNYMMRDIEKMGGDPTQGGAGIGSGGCSDSSTGTAGTGITKAINWAKKVAENDGYGYDQPGRATGWVKLQSDPACTSQCGSFDCSSLISAALTEAGYFTTNPNFSTHNEESELQKAGFTKVASSAKTSANLQPGDILITSGHTEMYIGNDQNVGAHHNESGGVSGGSVGDQTGDEISVTSFWNDDWTGVWRASK